MKRRELLTSAGLLGVSQALAPVKAIAAEAKSIRINAIETFNLELPATPTKVEAGVLNRISVTRVITESGVKGFPALRRGGRVYLASVTEEPLKNPARIGFFRK